MSKNIKKILKEKIDLIKVKSHIRTGKPIMNIRKTYKIDITKIK